MYFSRSGERHFPHVAMAHSMPGPPHYRGFTVSLRHTALSMTTLDEWSARRRDFNLTTHNTHKKEITMLQAGFAPAIPASERPPTHTCIRPLKSRLMTNSLPICIWKEIPKVNYITNTSSPGNLYCLRNLWASWHTGPLQLVERQEGWWAESSTCCARYCHFFFATAATLA
jgi:hypothetical protein